MKQGRIIKATGGFYYVDTGEEILETKPRGIFRKEEMETPVVGDMVTVEDTGNHDWSNVITTIALRKNILVRPPVANLDYMVVVASTEDPAPNYVTLDKLLLSLESAGIPSVIVITKVDLTHPQEITAIYKKAGYPVFVVDYDEAATLKALTDYLRGNLCAFAGNSGVGKSTLLNVLDPSLGIAVGETSKKLGRGRHTTRHVEIHTLPQGLQVADTPGFSSLDLLQTASILAADLADYFIEFPAFSAHCRFRNCVHLKETGCAVVEAVDSGEISQSRYDSYQTIYNEIKDVKEWQRR